MTGQDAGWVAAMEAASVELTHRLAAADLAAAGYVVSYVVDEPDELAQKARDALLPAVWQAERGRFDPAAGLPDALEVFQADVERRAQLERQQTVELTCVRCRHGYRLHDERGCLQAMHDRHDCGCPGFAWVDPDGPAETYGQS